MEKTSSNPRSPVSDILLAKALRRFRTDLEGDVDERNIPNVANLEGLLQEAQFLETNATRPGKSKSAVQKLQPIISQISNFAAIIALCNGADPTTTGLVWGSLKVMLDLASRNQSDTVEKIVDMLGDLSLSLPRFRLYEETIPMNKDLESALVDVYAEMLCFCARTIKFFRRNPHKSLVSFSWKGLNSDFDSTIKRLKSLSKAVDTEAEAARLRMNMNQNRELLSALENLKVDDKSDTKIASLPCYVIPNGVNETFCGRVDILEKLQEILNPSSSSPNKRAVLHGLGGVGKTKVALEYVNQTKNQYDVIFWISADTPIKMTQDFLKVSRKLGLSPDDDEAQDSIAAQAKVKDWLAESPCRWLLIFDNADDVDTLEDAIPATKSGSILVTSRDSAAGDTIGAEAIQIQPFDSEAGVSAFQALLKQKVVNPADIEIAAQIVEQLGGLPLALAQISGFINQQRYSLTQFLRLYQKNAAKIDQKRVTKGSYEHTLSTVWSMSLDQLSGEAASLQNLLAFLDPDKIHESVLLEGGKEISEDEFAFLKDDMDFSDAKTPLLRSALVDRFYETESLSIHRLVQEAVIRRLTDADRTKYVDAVITLLSNSFPNSWNTVTSHQFSAWSKCELCLPHVSFLMKQCERLNVQPTDKRAYCELIFRTAWYLYEREQYNEAREFIQQGFAHLDQSAHELTYASALMLRGLVDLDTNQMQAALDAFQQALDIRLKLLDPDDAFIASCLNAISIAYTELGDIDNALQAGNKAIDIRLRTKSDRIGNSYSNMASTLLRMGKSDEAEEMLKRCPSLKDFTDETFLNTGNPRFSGDMVLLAKIRQSQGRIDEALRLSSKALDFRQSMLGSGLKTCDSLYQVASLLHIRGDLNLACNLLEQSIISADKKSYGLGYSARSRYKLSLVYRDMEVSAEIANETLRSAEALRARLFSGPLSEPTQEAYDRLVLFMLW